MHNPLTAWRRPWPSINDWGQFEKTMNHFFDDISSDRKALQGDSCRFIPACELNETKTHYNFKFDIPGIPKDQIKIELHENQLTVSGERKQESSDKSNGYQSEISYGSFLRSFTFPVKVDNERVEANFMDGVLKISIPKAEPNKIRQVQIK